MEPVAVSGECKDVGAGIAPDRVDPPGEVCGARMEGSFLVGAVELIECGDGDPSVAQEEGRGVPAPKTVFAYVQRSKRGDDRGEDGGLGGINENPTGYARGVKEDEGVEFGPECEGFEVISKGYF